MFIINVVYVVNSAADVNVLKLALGWGGRALSWARLLV